MTLPKFRQITITQKIKTHVPLKIEVIDRTARQAVIGRRTGEDVGDRNLLFLGKIVEEGTLGSDYKNFDLWLDITRPHVIFICGKRGEGKSYDLGIILEGLLATEKSQIASTSSVLPAVVFDTQDQFWTMSFPLSPDDREDKRQLESLREWGLQPARFDIQVLVPVGVRRLSDRFDYFSLNPGELDPTDWCGLFQFDPYEPSGHLVLVAYNKVATDGYTSVTRDPETGEIVKQTKVKANPDYSIEDLIQCILTDEEIMEPRTGFANNTIRAVVSRLEWARKLPVFGEARLDISKILAPGKVSVVQLRELSDSAKALVVGVITRKVFERMGRTQRLKELERRLRGLAEKQRGDKEVAVELEKVRNELRGWGEMDQAWLLIDEAHVVCPASGYTAAKEKLVEFVKRGRDSGLSLVFATQQPSAVDSRLLSQLDILIVHRLATYRDISTARDNAVSPPPSKVTIGKAETTSDVFEVIIRSLQRGEAIVSDAQTNPAVVVRMRPRVSAHGGREPTLS